MSTTCELSNTRDAGAFVLNADQRGDDPHEIGQQLTPHTISWTGVDVANFMEAIYIHDRPRNVRKPGWRGFDRDGQEALAALLQSALPVGGLVEPSEIASCGVLFLTKNHFWETGVSGRGMDNGTFIGRSAAVGSVLGGVRHARYGAWSAEDVVALFTKTRELLDSRGRQWTSIRHPFVMYNTSVNGYIEECLQDLEPFFCNLDIILSEEECVRVVEGLVEAQWPASQIIRLVAAVVTPSDTIRPGDQLRRLNANTNATNYDEPKPISLTHATKTNRRFALEQQRDCSYETITIELAVEIAAVRCNNNAIRGE
eukprot:gene2952-3767_t